MIQPPGAAPWWSYAEKDAWYDFSVEHPQWADAITHLVGAIHFSPDNTTDRVLTSGVQIEGLFLRVAELLGLVEVERLP